MKDYFFVSHASCDKKLMRPVLERLLLLGIPLWLDKPGDPSLKFDEQRFAGFLREGEDWEVQLQRAIDGANGCRGMLAFVTPESAKSPVVANEVWQAKREMWGVYNYKIVPIRIGDCPSTCLRDLRIDKLHAFSLARDGDPSVLSEWDERETARIAQLLTDHLEGGRSKDRSSPEAPKPIASTLGVSRDETRPYRIDRKPQRQRFVENLEMFRPKSLVDEARPGWGFAAKKRDPRRPMFILYGESDHSPNKCAEVTLARRILGAPKGRFASRSDVREPVRCVWPEGSNAWSEVQGKLNDEIARGLQGLDKAENADAQMIAEALRDDGGVRVVSMVAHVAANALVEHVAIGRAWLNYWHDFPFDAVEEDGKVRVVPVLAFDLTDNGRKGFRAGAFERELAGHARSLKVRCVLFAPLAQITPSCVKHWLQDDDLFADEHDEWKSELEAELKRLFKPGELYGMNMKAWARASRSVLAKAYP